LPREHKQLMPQHEQFDVLCELAATASDKQPQQSREREIGEGEEHLPMLPEPAIGSVESWNLGFETPQVKRAAGKAKPARREDFARLEFHDLRHTFASLMIAAGANPLQLAEALGHTDQHGRPDPTLVWKRYGHLYPGSTREAAAALNRHLNAIAS
jgi:integrase